MTYQKSNLVRPLCQSTFDTTAVGLLTLAGMSTKPTTPADQARAAFGARLATARKKQGLTQDEVATRFGMNKATVSAWETGRGDPGVFRLHDLCRLYECSASFLMGEVVRSEEALKVAAEFDALNGDQRQKFLTLWTGFVAGTSTQHDAGAPVVTAADLLEKESRKKADASIDWAKARPVVSRG